MNRNNNNNNINPPQVGVFGGYNIILVYILVLAIRICVYYSTVECTVQCKAVKKKNFYACECVCVCVC